MKSTAGIAGSIVMRGGVVSPNNSKAAERKYEMQQAKSTLYRDDESTPVTANTSNTRHSGSASKRKR
jgi:hypothetical protein